MPLAPLVVDIDANNDADESGFLRPASAAPTSAMTAPRAQVAPFINTDTMPFPAQSSPQLQERRPSRPHTPQSHLLQHLREDVSERLHGSTTLPGRETDHSDADSDFQTTASTKSGSKKSKVHVAPAPWIVKTAYIDDNSIDASSFSQHFDTNDHSFTTSSSVPTLHTVTSRNGKPRPQLSFALDASEMSPSLDTNLHHDSFKTGASGASTPGRRSLSSLTSLRIELRLKECLDRHTGSPVSLEDFREYMIHVEHGCEMIDFYLAVEGMTSLFLAAHHAD